VTAPVFLPPRKRPTENGQKPPGAIAPIQVIADIVPLIRKRTLAVLAKMGAQADMSTARQLRLFLLRSGKSERTASPHVG
jgi:hypothetical protein